MSDKKVKSGSWRILLGVVGFALAWLAPVAGPFFPLVLGIGIAAMATAAGWDGILWIKNKVTAKTEDIYRVNSSSKTETNPIEFKARNEPTKAPSLPNKNLKKSSMPSPAQGIEATESKEDKPNEYPRP